MIHQARICRQTTWQIFSVIKNKIEAWTYNTLMLQYHDTREFQKEKFTKKQNQRRRPPVPTYNCCLTNILTFIDQNRLYINKYHKENSNSDCK